MVISPLPQPLQQRRLHADALVHAVRIKPVKGYMKSTTFFLQFVEEALDNQVKERGGTNQNFRAIWNLHRYVSVFI